MASADARVVALSSVTPGSRPTVPALHRDASKTNGNYAASKLACLAFTIEAQKRLDAHHGQQRALRTADPGS